MYQDYINMYFNDPYRQDAFPYLPPIQSEGFYVPFDERQFGTFFPQMGPPTGPGFQPPFTQPEQGTMTGPPTSLPPGPGFQPPFAQPEQEAMTGPPTSPPPSFVPSQAQGQAQPFAVDPGSIRRCLFRHTYVWLVNGQQFWFYPIFVGPNSVSGYRWTGFRWVFFGVGLRFIHSFTCV